MQVHAGGDGSFDKRLAQIVLAEHNQRNGPLNSRAAARFFSYEIIRSSCKRRLAHVLSLEWALGFARQLERLNFTGEFPPFPSPLAGDVSRTLPHCRIIPAVLAEQNSGGYKVLARDEKRSL